MKAPAPTDRVRDEWLRRVEAEYRSAAIAHHLTLWLIQVGASPDLLSAGLRIVKDELTHASMSHRAFLAAGGTGGPTLARETLGLLRNEREPLEHDVARVAVEVFCLGETVAVPLFHRLRRTCTVPAARRVLDRVLKDEVRHRDFGWLLLGWLGEHPLAPALRDVVLRELPGMFARLEASYAPSELSNDIRIADAERAWGLMPSAEYGEVLRRAVRRDYLPRFERLGYDVRAAMRA